MADTRLPPLPKLKGNYWYWDEFVATLPAEVLVRAPDPVDSRDLVLLKDGEGRYGFLAFGTGSCGHCDQLLACGDDGQVARLREKIWRGVHWEPTAGHMLGWIAQRDWKLQWYGHLPCAGRFVTESAELLHVAAERETRWRDA